MYQFFRALVLNLVYIFAWILDYVYLIKWQLLSSTTHRSFFTNVSPVNTKTVILIPGIYENWQFMRPVALYLNQLGHSIHVVKELGYNRGSIEEMAAHIEKYIQKAQLENVSIVAHSKGGLIAKQLLVRSEANIRRVITINTPFNGSLYAQFFFVKELRMFSSKSSNLRILNENTIVNQKITSLYSKFDPHIPNGSYLKGAKNIQFQKIGHFSPLSDKAVLELIKNELVY